jgi:hypothetical protein
MRKIWSLILILIVLSGCNLPTQSTLAPTGDVLATQVAVKLTAAPTASKALISTLSATLPPKINTLAPTPSPTISPSAKPTSITITVPVPSATFTQTATSIPGDPRIALGKETWKDNFSKPATWGLDSPYDDGHTRVSISLGKLILSSLEGNNWHGWRMYNAKLQNFYLEVTVQTHDCSGSDLYGLIFRSPDGFKGYWYGITCDGKYSLESGDINSSAVIITGKNNPILKAGSNQTNRLGVMAKGNKLSLYANGKLLEEVANETLPDAGIFGYFIAGAKTLNFTYDSTEIIYWKLP